MEIFFVIYRSQLGLINIYDRESGWSDHDYWLYLKWHKWKIIVANVILIMIITRR